MWKRLKKWRALAKKKQLDEIKRAILLEHNGTKRWYEVEDVLPETGRWVLGYTEVFGSYHLCQYLPARGWQLMDGAMLANISHWCDDFIFMPFEIRNEVDELLAKKHGFRMS
jgi:hypothetical protein